LPLEPHPYNILRRYSEEGKGSEGVWIEEDKFSGKEIEE
jgi:hypothetical protein